MPLVSVGLLAMTAWSPASDHRRKAWRQGVVTSGLQFWYKFLSGAETADSSGSGRTLTLYNSPTFVAGPGGSSAINFNGTNQHAQCTTADLGSVSAMTVCFWVAMNSATPPAGSVVPVGESYPFEWNLYHDSGVSHWYIQGYDSATTHGYSRYSQTLNHTDWRHLAGIYESGGAGFRLYYNGVSVGSPGGSASLALKDSTSLLTIGSTGGGDFWLPGRLADVRIYNRALSQAEIDTIRSNPPQGAVSVGAGSVTQDFNAYTDSTSLATFSGWTVAEGAFRTGAAATAGSGEVTSNTAATVCSAIYEPSGFTCSANHQVEVTLDTEATGSIQAQGAAVAIQASGACYHCYVTATGTVYFGVSDASGAGSEYVNTTVSSFVLAGFKIRLTVSGTSPSRACTAEYNNGAGWVTPSGWSAKVFTSQLAAGRGGISGYSNEGGTSITSLTITNQ
jgi:hypothetical protein